MNWSLLPTISGPMLLQMALDELLFESQKKKDQVPTLRFYVSSTPSISVGCSFRGSGSLSKSELVLKNPQVPVCRRITGGGCVMHGRDLIFSLLARVQSDPEGLGPVRASYAKIHESVRMGLQRCGLDPKFYSSRDELRKGNDCFDFPVESDLSWKGKKIAGGAQKRSEGVLLHHESISLPTGVEREDVIRAIRKGLEQVFAVTMENVDLDPEFYFQAERKALSLQS
jgi:lipoate-protein ligase A